MSPTTKLRRTLALALAGGSLAIGVPAALAAGGGDEPDARGTAAPSSGFVQDEQDRPDHDCPEREGREDGGGSGEEGGSSADATTTPAV